MNPFLFLLVLLLLHLAFHKLGRKLANVLKLVLCVCVAFQRVNVLLVTLSIINLVKLHWDTILAGQVLPSQEGAVLVGLITLAVLLVRHILLIELVVIHFGLIIDLNWKADKEGLLLDVGSHLALLGIAGRVHSGSGILSKLPDTPRSVLIAYFQIVRTAPKMARPPPPCASPTYKSSFVRRWSVAGCGLYFSRPSWPNS